VQAKRFWGFLFLGLGASLVFFLADFICLYYGVFPIPDWALSRRDALIFAGALFLITAWGIAILYRLQDKREWRLFLAILILSQIWLYSGFLKRFVGFDDAADIALWRFSYGPMLFMPGVWFGLVYAAFYPKSFAKPLWILSGIALVLFLLVLTNELHHWAFIPVYDDAGAIVRWKHGWLFYVVFAYAILLLLASILLFVFKALAQRHLLHQISGIFVPLALLVAYSVLYALDFSFIRHTPVLSNYYVMYALLGFALIELALREGLVQNGGNYRSYFVKGPYALALLSRDYRVYARNEAFSLAPEIQSQDEVIVKGSRYRKKPFEGGYLVIQEDISDILSLQKELLLKKAELSQTTAYLSKRKIVERELESLAAKEKLTASLLKEIQEESATIETLVDSLPDRLDEETRRSSKATLEELQNRLSFLKQRCLFVINGSENEGLSREDFSLSEGSLCRDLQNVGFLVGVRHPDFERISLSTALRVNAFLKAAVLSFGEVRGSLLLSFDPLTGALKARLSPDRALPLTSFAFAGKATEEEGEIFLSEEGIRP
jgi:hypothetical protein